jgi:ferredoxin-thioredoxin reductase catalytic subunit
VPDDELESEILEWARKYAQEQHWVLNPDHKKLDIVIRGLARNQRKFGERYCPCRLRTGDPAKDRDIICPCIFHRDEVDRDGMCHCHLYFRKGNPI